MCNPWNSEPRHIGNPEILRNLTYLKPDTHSELSQKLKMQHLVKTVKNYNHFSTTLYLRSLTGFWVCPSLNKYSLTCKVISHCVSYDTYSELCHIQNSDIFKARDIFRTISRHILAYSECCVTLAIFRTLLYSGFWHIYNPRHIQNPVYLGILRHIEACSIMIVIITLSFFFSL